MLFADQIKLGWEVLARLESLRPKPTARPGPYRDLPVAAGVQMAAAPLDAPPTLDQLLTDLGALPPYSIAIGACPDHAHIFLDLTDPRPGSILIAGDPQSGKTSLLRTILASAARLNTPRRLRYALVSARFTEIRPLTETPHCYKAYAAQVEQSSRLLLEMADLVEKRQKEPAAGNAILFAIDDLATWLEYLAAENDSLVEQLRWLIQSGPEVRVWTLATLGAADLDRVAGSILEAFDTRLVGRTESPESAAALVGAASSQAQALAAGKQFGLIFGETWTPFWVPRLDDSPTKKEVSDEYWNAVVR